MRHWRTPDGHDREARRRALERREGIHSRDVGGLAVVARLECLDALPPPHAAELAGPIGWGVARSLHLLREGRLQFAGGSGTNWYRPHLRLPTLRRIVYFAEALGAAHVPIHDSRRAVADKSGLLMGYGRIETPTPEQWQVAAWMAIVALAVLGTVGLWFGFQAPPAKADIGSQLKVIGVICWLLAFGLWGFKRGIEWFLD